MKRNDGIVVIDDPFGYYQDLLHFGVVHQYGVTDNRHGILSLKADQVIPNHSGLFVNSRPYLQYYKRRDAAASNLVRSLDAVGSDLGAVKYVFGSSSSSIQLLESVARIIDAEDVFTEKDSKGRQMWKKNGFWVKEQTGINVEELMTTLATADNVQQVYPGKILTLDGRPLIGTLFLRPEDIPPIVRRGYYSATYKDSRPYSVVATATVKVPKYPADNCDLCKSGSLAVDGRSLIQMPA